MSTASDILAWCEQRGVTLTLDGEQLRYHGTMTPALLERLRANKAELVRFLGQAANDDPLMVTCWTPNGDSIRIRARDADHAAWLKAVNPKPKTRPVILTDEQDGLAPYRVNHNGITRVVWLEPGLSPTQVLDAAIAKLSGSVSLEPPAEGWPRLSDLSVPVRANSTTWPTQSCPACHHGHFWLNQDGWRCSYCYPWPDEFRGETFVLPADMQGVKP